MSETLARDLGLSADGLRDRHASLLAQTQALAGEEDLPAGHPADRDDYDALALAAAYRDAAVIALCYDADTARDDLAQAAEWYRRLARPVTGWYRSVSPPIADWLDIAGGTGGSDRLSAAHRAATVIDRMLSSGPAADEDTAGADGPGASDPRPWRRAGAEGRAFGAGSPTPGPLARRNPAQDAYALLTGALLVRHHPKLPDVLGRTRATGQPLSAASVGALGMPLRWFWKASMLLALEDRPEPLLGHLLGAVRLQDTALREAQRDVRVYAQLMSPVDLVDLDIALLASAAALRWGIDDSAWEHFLLTHSEAEWRPEDALPAEPGPGAPAGEPSAEDRLLPEEEFWDWGEPAPRLGGVSVRAGLALGARPPPGGELDGPPA